MDMVSSDSGCCGACTTLAGFLVVVVDLFGFLYRDAASTVTRSAAVVVAMLSTSQSMHYCINQSINQSLSGLFLLQQNCLISTRVRARRAHARTHTRTHARTHTHTHTHTFNGPLSGTTRVSRYQKGKTNLDFTEARDSEWQWHPLCHMQVCTSLQTDNHTSTHCSVFYRPDALPAAQPTA